MLKSDHSLPIGPTMAHYGRPGQYHDSKGIPIYPGDLLRCHHFTGARRKRYYHYHTAIRIGKNSDHDSMYAVPTSALQWALQSPDGSYPLEVRDISGACLLSTYMGSDDITILHGFGDGESRWTSYEDRKRKPKEANQ